MTMRMVGPALALAMLLLASCAAVSTTDLNLDDAAKSFRASEGKAAIYIVPSFGAPEVAITMDGKKVGRLAPAQFLLLDASPGRHVLDVSMAGFLGVLPHDKSDELTLDAAAGQCYFLRTVWTDENRRWSHPRVFLEGMKDEDGRQAVMIRTSTPALK
jgi:hypothetical protein